MKAWIGIDVSMETLDVTLDVTPVKQNDKMFYKQLKNDKSGWVRVVKWIKTLDVEEPHFCMESTGAYSTGIAMYLVEQEYLVTVENPARIKHYGAMRGIINKNDKIDSKAIAGYCRLLNPAPWRMAAPEVRLLSALMRRYDDLLTTRNQENNRRKVPGLPKEVQNSITAFIKFIDKQIKELLDEINRHIDRHPGLKGDKEILESIPGISTMTSLWFLAELPDVNQFDTAKDAAAFAGLNPRERSSGTSVRSKTKLSKSGNRYLRKALYMPAMSAMKHNPIVKALYDRLKDKGHCGKSALAACMRKLLMIAYGVLKNKTKFDVGHVQKLLEVDQREAFKVAC